MGLCGWLVVLLVAGLDPRFVFLVVRNLTVITRCLTMFLTVVRTDGIQCFLT